MSLSRNANLRLRTGTVRFMAGLAQDENPREMAQWHSQEWLCHWGCRPNPQRRGRLKEYGLREKDVGSC